MDAAEGEAPQDFSFEDENTGKEDLESRPTQRFKKVEQKLPKGEDPAAYFKDLADQARGKMKFLQENTATGKRGMNFGAYTVSLGTDREGLGDFVAEVEGRVAKLETEMAEALSEARRCNRMAAACENGNDPKALEKAHDILLEQSVAQDLVIEDLRASEEELQNKKAALADKKGDSSFGDRARKLGRAHDAAELRKRLGLEDVTETAEEDGGKDKPLDSRPSFLAREIRQVQEKISVAQAEKDGLEKMARHVRDKLGEAN